MVRLGSVVGLAGWIISQADAFQGSRTIRRQSNLSSLNQSSVIVPILEALPGCGLSCLTTSAEAANCSLTNADLLSSCICIDVSLLQDFNACVQTACTSIDDQETAFDVENSFICGAYPLPSRSSVGLIAASVTIAVSIPLVVARCVARLKLTRRLWSDDYMILFSEALLLSLASMMIVSVEKGGLGRHYWTIDLDDAIRFRQFLYASKILYVIVQCAGKIAVLLVYRRIFDSGGVARWFRNAIKILLVFTLMQELIFVLIIAFQCSPVAALWDKSITDANCIQADVAFLIGGILNIVGDVILMLLPFSELRKLQISTRKRVGVAVMFAIASLGIVASLVRIKFLAKGSSSFDSTWFYTDVLVWSLIECLCVVVCGSIPALRPYLSRSWWSITNAVNSSFRTRQDASVGSSKVESSTARASVYLRRQSGTQAFTPLASRSKSVQWQGTIDSPRASEPSSGRFDLQELNTNKIDPIPEYADSSRRNSSSGSEEDLVIMGKE